MDKRNIEINPIDKIDEIMSIFKDFSPKLFSKNDEGYDWIKEDDSKCIVFLNPFCEDNLEINVGDMGEFTLYFGWSHTHYLSYQLDYEELISMVKNILNNKACAGVLFDTQEKWFGSGIFQKEEINKEVTEIFNFVFKEKEFRNKLLKSGYVVKYMFWNPTENKLIKSTFSPTHIP